MQKFFLGKNGFGCFGLEQRRAFDGDQAVGSGRLEPFASREGVYGDGSDPKFNDDESSFAPSTAGGGEGRGTTIAEYTWGG